METIKANKVVILTAATGTGKSTQVPFYLAFDFHLKKLLNMNIDAPVICTQPRKISNVSASNRTCAEFELVLDTDVISIIGQNQEIHNRSGKVMYINEHALLVHLINNPHLVEYTT